MSSAKPKGAQRLLAALMAGSVLLCADAAVTELAPQDLQIIARTLGFLNPPLAGELRVGIVYDPSSTAASLEANKVRTLMSESPNAGSLKLQPVLVTFAEAAGANVDLFLLTAGNGQLAAELPAILENRKLPCFCVELEAVRAGFCTVGIQALPRVEILVNSKLAHDSDLTFASVFRMMVKEF